MKPEITVLFRGKMTSCNYKCGYCSFENKRRSGNDNFNKDKGEVENFLRWIDDEKEISFSIFFTPMGEALIHGYYIDAIVTLSFFPNVKKIAIQTNLSCDPYRLMKAQYNKLALWCTYHPGQISSDEFIEKINHLRSLNISLSVGMVGIKENFGAMFEMKKKLPDDVYLWINAYKHDGYYDETDMEFLGDIDRYFFMNNRNYESENEPCMTGEKVFSVRNDGNIYRCHFDEEILGNIKEDDINLIMQKRLCKKKTCNCHIGFVFMEKPGFDKVYGKGLLERNPYLK